MKGNKTEKMVYVSPIVEVTRIVLEGNIAVQSLIQEVELKNWDYEDSESDVNNSSDIWLNI